MKVGSWSVWSVRNVSLPTGIAALVVVGAAPLMGWALARERWSILALLVLLAAVPLVIRWPVISAFGTYAFLVPFELVGGLDGGATIARLAGMLAAVVLLATGLIERRLSRPPRAALWWALWLLWAVMSSAWTISDPESLLLGMQTIFSLFLLYMVAVSVRVSQKELVWICVLIVVGATLAAGLSGFYGVEAAYDPTNRAGVSKRGTLALGGQVAGHNAFAAGLLLPLALAMASFIGMRSGRLKILSVAAIGIMSGAIYLTMSRGALLALVAMGAIFMYRFRARWQVLVVACLLLGMAAMMPSMFFDRILAIADKDATGAGRTNIWATGIEALRTHGLVGAGFSSFVDAYSATVPLAYGKGARGAHNIYLGTWVELGIVGLVLLLGALGSHLLAAHRARDATGPSTITMIRRATEAACYGVLVSAFFVDLTWRKGFWLPFILLAWSVQEQRKRLPVSGATAREPVSSSQARLPSAAPSNL